MTANAPMLAEPVQLTHSWPLYERTARFDLGLSYAVASAGDGGLSLPQPGQWSCRLADDALSWLAEVYRLFGLPLHETPARVATVALYADDSRAKMERLRAHAIRHRRGFTLDAEICPATGPRRWMRLTAAPIIEGDRVTQLHGFKAEVTHLYRPARA